MLMLRLLAVLGAVGLAVLLKGCGCDREKIMSCITTKATASSSVCGETDYSKVFSGDTTVAACCQAIKDVQDCYLDGCDCDTECAEQDKAAGCTWTGKLRDPISFWAGIMDGLNKGGETCASTGVSASRCY
ncbi:unnamed protein product [Durusdinium trenchii]|uniref:Uncharacterized protein n=2 Tax=Durusdinium trenchii TaxID=1381693 RepID=A0ABP0Q894_9DINO